MTLCTSQYVNKNNEQFERATPRPTGICELWNDLLRFSLSACNVLHLTTSCLLEVEDVREGEDDWIPVGGTLYQRW